MWPEVNLKERYLDNMNYVIKQAPEENTIVKEIVMVYADYTDVLYDTKDVACALEYDTEFGLHTILFSKVDHLQYENHGCDWISVYSSKYKPGDDMGDGKHFSIPVEVLTDIYKNLLKYLQERDKKMRAPSPIQDLTAFRH